MCMHSARRCFILTVRVCSQGKIQALHCEYTVRGSDPCTYVVIVTLGLLRREIDETLGVVRSAR